MEPIIMGILNVTPDSFFDGGRYEGSTAAIAHGRAMIAAGAEIIDVGGESTRPGAVPVSEQEELRRVIPVIEALVSNDARISIDTTKPAVAVAAIAAGATLVNDVSSQLIPVAAEYDVGLVLMHMQGSPTDMQRNPHYDDVVREVFGYLSEKAKQAHDAGVEEYYVDPGIGFGKTMEHNLALLRALPELVAAGSPVAIGTSRKGFIGRALGTASAPLPVDDRFEGSLATAVWAMAAGATIIRVHDVKATADAARLFGDVTPERREEQLVSGAAG